LPGSKLGLLGGRPKGTQRVDVVAEARRRFGGEKGLRQAVGDVLEVLLREAKAGDLRACELLLRHLALAPDEVQAGAVHLTVVSGIPMRRDPDEPRTVLGDTNVALLRASPLRITAEPASSPQATVHGSPAAPAAKPPSASQRGPQAVQGADRSSPAEQAARAANGLQHASPAAKPRPVQGPPPRPRLALTEAGLPRQLCRWTTPGGTIDDLI